MKLILIAESLDGQTYSHKEDGPEYTVSKLYEYAKGNLHIKQIPVSELVHNIDPKDGISADEPLDSTEFHKRAMKADFNYPILLHKIDSKLWVIDGSHRIYKANHLKIPSLSAYVFTKLPSRQYNLNERYHGRFPASPLSGLS